MAKKGALEQDKTREVATQEALEILAEIISQEVEDDSELN